MGWPALVARPRRRNLRTSTPLEWEPTGSTPKHGSKTDPKNTKINTKNSGTPTHSTTPHSDSGSDIIKKIQNKEFDSKLQIVKTDSTSKTPYINARIKLISGKSVKDNDD